MAKENYWVVKVGVMKLWRGLCQAMDFAALEKGKTMAKEYVERKRAIVDACNSLELYPSEYATLEDALNRIPAADVVEVRHGRWEAWMPDKNGETREFICTGCRFMVEMSWKQKECD